MTSNNNVNDMMNCVDSESLENLCSQCLLEYMCFTLNHISNVNVNEIDDIDSLVNCGILLTEYSSQMDVLRYQIVERVSQLINQNKDFDLRVVFSMEDILKTINPVSN